jgi:GGDEF-like domain/PucR C-terminal helix-turn-helix domain
MGSEARSLEEARADLAQRLRARRTTIEESIVAQVRRVAPNPVEIEEDPEYIAGLRAAVTAIVDYGLAGIEQGEEWSGPIPSSAIAQAHRAARDGVSLDTILRRYMLGDRVLGEFVIDEVESLLPQTLPHVFRAQGSLLDRLMVSIATEYRQETERMQCSSEQCRARRVQKLLAGEHVSTAGLDYEFDGWHLGVIATGAKREETVRGLAAKLGRQALLVSRGEETVWAWFGNSQRPAVADVVRLLKAKVRSDVCLTIGEPGKGLHGFRVTHQQAQAAQVVALRRPQLLTQFGDVALLALALRDEALSRSMVDLYLTPLDNTRKGSPALRTTLRAYFAAERNISSAAARLGVARQTVQNHIGMIEVRLGRRLPTCMAELETALCLEELNNLDKPDDVSFGL